MNSDSDLFALIISLVATIGFFGAIIIPIVVYMNRKKAETRAREESRREIAAYVAEGTMSADDAAKILSAGEPAREAMSQKTRREIAMHVADGKMSADDGAKLLASEQTVRRA